MFPRSFPSSPLGPKLHYLRNAHVCETAFHVRGDLYGSETSGQVRSQVQLGNEPGGVGVELGNEPVPCAESKLGPDIAIRHRPEDLIGSVYGSIIYWVGGQ